MANTDRNLLFGILALQMDFISREALVKAMNAWVLEKAKGLGQILVEQKALASERHALLEALVQEHLKQHGNDAEQSLAAVSSVASVRDELKKIADSDLHASLAHVAMAPQDETGSWATRAPSVGTSTSSGLRFRILRPYAKGGLGQVSVARDEELHREVALKEIQNQYADDAGSRTRFVQEAEITGGLEHPGIVPVYGLGQYADGRPFYAMRFIRGDSLKDAIERFHKAEGANRDPGERTLEFRQLLARFVDVCNAIAYAHSRGVLHRDLKPGNIMLGRYGETLVVDWGLAKAIDQPEQIADSQEGLLKPTSASGSAPTQMGSALGTPQFMSPEQAAGRLDLLGAWSDVYSLGATLYSLLTGQPPFSDPDLGAMLLKVQRGELIPPRQKKRDVAPALEAICLKAMALKPEDRYASPRALADDLEHWLADEPVTAYPEPPRLRARRWARRHKTKVAATTAAVVVATLLGGVGAWWIHQQQAAAAARQNERDQVEAVRRQGIEEKARLALQRAHGLLDEGWRSHDLPKLKEAKAEADSAVEVADSGASAETQQQTLRFQKEVQTRINRARKNSDLLIALLDVSSPRETSTYVQNPSGGLMRLVNPSVDEQYVDAFRNWGLDVDRTPVTDVVARIQDQPQPVRDEIVAGLDRWMQERRELKRPEAQWRLLLGVTDQLHPSELRRGLRPLLIGEMSPREQIVDTLTTALLPWTGVYELDRGKHWRRLLELQGKVDLVKEPVLTVVLLANALSEPGDAAGAENILRGALAARPDQIVLLNALGKLLERQGRSRLGEALECYRAVRALRPQLGIALAEALRKFGKPTEGEAILRDLVRRQPNNPETSAYLGNALRAQNKLDDAEAAYRKAIELQPANAVNYHNLGTVLYAEKKIGAAVAAFRKAIELQPSLVQAYFHLSVALTDQKKTSEADVVLRKGLALEPEDAETYYYRGNVLLWSSQKKPALAEIAYRKAVALAPEYANAYAGLGQALYEQKKYAEAERVYRRAIQLQPDLVDAYINFGLVLEQQKKYAEAEAACRKLIELQPDNSLAYNNLGAYLSDQNRQAEALAAYRKAVEIQPDFVLANNNLANILRDLKQPAEAAAAYRKVIALQPNDAAAYVNLGLTLRDQQRLAEAEAVFRTAGILQPDYAAAYTNLGFTLRESHKPVEAVAAFRKVVQLQPTNADAYNDLGVGYLSQKKPDEAAAAFRKAIELSPGKSAYYNNLSIALRDQKKLEESLAACRKAIELKADYATAYENLGLSLREQKKLDEALAAFRKANQLLPNQPRVHYGISQTIRWLELKPKLDASLEGKQKPASPQESAELAEMCAAFLEQYRAALRFLTEAFQDDPKLAEDPQAQYRYNAACYAALVAAEQGKDAVKLDEKEQAGFRRQALDWLKADLKADRALLEKSKENRPLVEQRLRHWLSDSDLTSIRDEKRLTALPKAERQECQQLWVAVKEVLKEIEVAKAIDLGPDDPTSYYYLGVALYAKKDWQGASAAYRKAAELAPKNDKFQNRLGNALYAKKSWKDAVTAYRKAIELAPTNAVYRNNLGNALRDQRKFADAAAAYRQAVALQPDYGLAYSNLGLALRSQRKLEEAVAAFQKAAKLLPNQVSIRNNLRQTEGWLKLAPKLEACLAGTEKPDSPRESAELGEVPSYLQQYRAAVGLVADAFQGDPKLADNLKAGHRYKAASYAVLAAAGKGQDAASLSTQERADLRRQALDWLRADLQANRDLLDKAKENRTAVRQRLASWLRDTPLASVRDEKALAAFPEQERKAWEQLWTAAKGILSGLDSP